VLVIVYPLVFERSLCGFAGFYFSLLTKGWRVRGRGGGGGGDEEDGHAREPFTRSSTVLFYFVFVTWGSKN
jgi:hypothetical protein